jgi:hypothetical protein
LNALRDASVQNFALFSCFVNGAPAAAIVAINQDGGEYAITPLFVSVTETMRLTDHEGVSPAETPAVKSRSPQATKHRRSSRICRSRARCLNHRLRVSLFSARFH